MKASSEACQYIKSCHVAYACPGSTIDKYNKKISAVTLYILNNEIVQGSFQGMKKRHIQYERVAPLSKLYKKAQIF